MDRNVISEHDDFFPRNLIRLFDRQRRTESSFRIFESFEAPFVDIPFVSIRKITRILESKMRVNILENCIIRLGKKYLKKKKSECRGLIGSSPPQEASLQISKPPASLETDNPAPPPPPPPTPPPLRPADGNVRFQRADQ